MTTRHETGRKGELKAKAHLLNAGFKIIDYYKEWSRKGKRQTPFDIIAERGGRRYGIQVKTSSYSFTFQWRNIERLKEYARKLYYIPAILFIHAGRFILFTLTLDNIEIKLRERVGMMALERFLITDQ